MAKARTRNRTKAEAAQRLGVSERFLAQEIAAGRGPAVLRFGRRVLIADADLAAYEARCRHPSSKQPGAN